MAKKSSEKVHIINETVPNFSRQFFTIPISLFGVITDVSLEIFSLYFLIKTQNLTDLIPLIIVFILVNLVWFILFNYFAKKFQERNNKKKIVYQQDEKLQVRKFLENLNTINNKSGDLERLYKLINHNSEKISFLNLATLFFSLPDLIIPGFSIFFLFLYYQFYSGGKGGLS